MNQPSTSQKKSPEAGANATGSGAAGPRRTTSEALFRGESELRILHAGQEYRLSITSKGKLIL
ncbi:MAG: hemin uptake protein HemP, partial [Pseudomonadota bacterium]